jgi:hypothetical protein
MRARARAPQTRASAAVAAKDAWWAQRRETAQEAVRERTFQVRVEGMVSGPAQREQQSV